MVSSQRNDSIDALRFIAASGVVLSHALNKYDLYGYGGKLVCLFFMISGFVIFGPRKNNFSIPDFLYSRAKRIYPRYIIASLIAMLGYLAIDKRFDYVEIIRSFLLIPNLRGGIYYPILMVGWSLCFEMLFYVKYALLSYVSHKYILPMFLVTALLLLYGNIYSAETFLYVLQFWIGGFIRRIYLSGWTGVKSGKIAILGIIIYSIAEYMFYVNSKYSEVALCISAILILVGCEKIQAIHKCAKLGRLYSYEIYLFHPVFMTIVFFIMPQKTIVYFPIVFVLSVILPLLFAKMMNKLGVG